MKVTISCLKETDEVKLVRDFCKWQGFSVAEKKGPYIVPRIEFFVAPGFGITGKNDNIERVSGLINLVKILSLYGMLRC